MLNLLLFILSTLFITGCATTEGYNPVTAGTTGTYELNQSALKKVTIGMSENEAHGIMGETIIIGYNYVNEGDVTATPITLKNPYKITESEDAKGKCKIEYYATSVLIPDGVVTDSELMPLKFCNGVLTAKGWDKIK